MKQVDYFGNFTLGVAFKLFAVIILKIFNKRQTEIDSAVKKQVRLG